MFKNFSPPSSGFLPGQALPPGAMQPLPKRPILEKSNGAAATVFNPNMFHYQQALANMQLQQPAFIPTGESLHTLATLKHSPDSVYLTMHVGGKLESVNRWNFLAEFFFFFLCLTTIQHCGKQEVTGVVVTVCTLCLCKASLQFNCSPLPFLSHHASLPPLCCLHLLHSCLTRDESC